MFCVAGERALHPLRMFKHTERGGFSGRRAFEKQDKETYDQFYRAIQSVVSAAAAKAKAFGRCAQDGQAPRDGLIVFPLIVVDTNLFEAYYDPHGDEVRVSETDQLRIFWRGAKANRRAITAVDIVTAKVVSDFAKTRISEIDQFLTEAAGAAGRIRAGFAEGKFEKLAIKAAPRGFTGMPPLLVDLYKLAQSKKAAAVKRGLTSKEK